MADWPGTQVNGSAKWPGTPVKSAGQAEEKRPIGFKQSAIRAIKNIPSSALRAGKAMVQPVIHPVETAENFANIGQGILQYVGVESGTEYEKYPQAVGRYFVDRYGSLENLKKTIVDDPVGFAMDASSLLSGGGLGLKGLGAAGEAAGFADTATAIKTAGGVAQKAGDIVNPAAVAGKLAAKTGGIAGHLVTKIPGGIGTYVGEDPLIKAFASAYEGGPPQAAFQSQFGHKAPIDEPVNDMERALAYMHNEAKNKYVAELGPITKDPKILPQDKIDAAVPKMRELFQYAGKSGVSDPLLTDELARNTFRRIAKRIETWKQADPREFWTVEGVDKLKRSIGEVYRQVSAAHPNSGAEKVAAIAYNAVKDTITTHAPDYAKIMKDYDEAESLIREIQKTFSVNRKGSIDTQLRKLQSVMRNNVNTSFGYRKKLAQYLLGAGAPYLFEKLSAQALDSWIPRGLGRVTTGGAAILGLMEDPSQWESRLPVTAAVLGLSSPRTMGHVAQGLGTGMRRAKSIPARSLFEAGQFGSEPFDGGVRVTPTQDWTNPFPQP